MIGRDVPSAFSPLSPLSSDRIERLVPELKHPEFRAEYFARQLKMFLAAQIRALRGGLTQAEFGRRIGKPQSVVSRLERQSYGKVNLQTLIDIATKLDIEVVIRFVTLPTFLKWTNDYSPEALAPEPFNERQLDDLLRKEAKTKRITIRPLSVDETPPQFKIADDDEELEQVYRTDGEKIGRDTVRPVQ